MIPLKCLRLLRLFISCRVKVLLKCCLEITLCQDNFLGNFVGERNPRQKIPPGPWQHFGGIFEGQELAS